VGDARFFLQGQIDFQFAAAVSITLTLCEFAGNPPSPSMG
jgi:hypothetical protein